jgi:hypothetical protein
MGEPYGVWKVSSPTSKTISESFNEVVRVAATTQTAEEHKLPPILFVQHGVQQVNRLRRFQAVVQLSQDADEQLVREVVCRAGKQNLVEVV